MAGLTLLCVEAVITLERLTRALGAGPARCNHLFYYIGVFSTATRGKVTLLVSLILNGRQNYRIGHTFYIAPLILPNPVLATNLCSGSLFCSPVEHTWIASRYYQHLHRHLHRHLQRHLQRQCHHRHDSSGLLEGSASASFGVSALPRTAMPMMAPDHLPRFFRKLLLDSSASSVTESEEGTSSPSAGDSSSLSSKSSDITIPPSTYRQSSTPASKAAVVPGTALSLSILHPWRV